MKIHTHELLKCEHLSFDVHTINQIEKFKVKYKDAVNLELYLKEFSPKDELHHRNRTYLVKDKFTDEIACYFSLRNGLFTLNTKDDYFATVPAIELSNFAVNETFREKHSNITKIGSTVIKNFILPIVKQAQNISGVQALYIYAFPNERLIQHYTSLGFSRLDANEEAFVHQHVKPKYDEGCIFMFQGV